MSDAAAHLATLVVHPKENPAKCTLEPLRGRPGLRFIDHEPGAIVDAGGHVLLEVGAPPLTRADGGRPLLLLDATWRLLPALRQTLSGSFACRSLPPGLRTAYPRRSGFTPDPDDGLASVEALFAARCILGFRDDTFLESYHWKEAFLLACGRAGIL